MIFIIDIDGTLADLSHREHFVDREYPDWDSFFSPDEVSKDKPIPKTKEGLEAIITASDEAYFLTGRPEHLRAVTMDWLEQYYGISVDNEILFMRPEGDERKSTLFKKDIIEQKFKTAKDLWFIDDEAGNLEMFSNYGNILKAPEIWAELEAELD